MASRRFIDEEAGVDSEEDANGDYEEHLAVEAIEAEEADIRGFINDSSQLGYSPDALEEVDPDARGSAVHRSLDNQRISAQQFATPVLNRRMKESKNIDSWDKKAPDSANGLGKMHFIRSVIEHHQKGGEAEDIEQAFREMEEEAGPIDEEPVLSERRPPVKTVLYYEPSDSEDD